MVSEKQIIDFILNGHTEYMTGLSLDCVIFGYHDQELKVLLGKYNNLDGWGIPGAYIRKNETFSAAAQRILLERTSLENIFLEQFYAFGDNEERIQRRAGDEMLMEITGGDEDNWLLQRTISIGYYALIEYSLAKVQNNYPFVELSWHNIQSLPEKIMFDHKEILDKALITLRNHLHLKPIGYNLLPEKFTLPEIHVLYETILNKKLDRRNFPKKLMASGVLERLDEKRKIGQHRSPFLYKFNQKKYEEVLMEGLALFF